jgi:hypothetical protein
MRRRTADPLIDDLKTLRTLYHAKERARYRNHARFLYLNRWFQHLRAKLYQELHPERRPSIAGLAFRNDLPSRPRHQGFSMLLGGPIAAGRLLDGLLPDVRQ